MQKSLKESIFMATLSQLLGVSFALFGFLGIFFARGTEMRWWSWVGILVPFALAYSTAISGFVYYGCFSNSASADKKMYKFFILLYLYTDAFLLPIMVGFSGGVKQSLFTPLFFTIPAMAVVFVPPCESRHLWMVTVVTLIFYIMVYWLPIGPESPGCFYRIVECVILGGSVVLTVLMSRRMRSLL